MKVLDNAAEDGTVLDRATEGGIQCWTAIANTGQYRTALVSMAWVLWHYELNIIL